jgi:polyisoprenoid-binding protein YceI
MADRKAVRAGRLCGLIFVAALAGAPAAAKPENYELDPAHTQVLFSVDRFGFSRILGQFSSVSGAIRIDEEAPEKSSVEVVIDVAGIASGNAERDSHLKDQFWFDAAAHPKIRFKSTSVELTDERTARVTGKLTIRDVTKPVTLDVTLNRIGQDPATQKQAAGFSASTRIDRTDFGMDTAPELIGTEVTIQIEALAHLTAE